MDAQTEQFVRELNLSVDGKKYLHDRFNNFSVIKEFELGFCPPASQAKYKFLNELSFDFLNGRLILPIYNSYGELIAYAGRRIDSYSKYVLEFYKERYDSIRYMEKMLQWKKSKWINTPYDKKNNLFNLHRAKKDIFTENLCVIVEGYFDVMRLHDAGIKNVVAVCGSTLTDTQADLIYRYCERVIIMLDGDEVGKLASEKAIERLQNKNIYANLVELPENKDPDDLESDLILEIYNEIKKSNKEVYIKI